MNSMKSQLFKLSLHILNILNRFSSNVSFDCMSALISNFICADGSKDRRNYFFSKFNAKVELQLTSVTLIKQKTNQSVQYDFFDFFSFELTCCTMIFLTNKNARHHKMFENIKLS